MGEDYRLGLLKRSNMVRARQHVKNSESMKYYMAYHHVFGTYRMARNLQNVLP